MICGNCGRELPYPDARFCGGCGASLASANARVSWWRTLPGIVTAVAGAITAVTGLIIALNQAGLMSGTKGSQPLGGTTPIPSDQTAERPATTKQTVSDVRN